MTSLGIEPAMLVAALPVAAIGLALLLCIGLVLRERDRRRLLRWLRFQWGRGDENRLAHLLSIGEWHRFHRDGADPATLIDDRTWEDLHLDRIFGQLDHTQSRIGQQVLYHQLHATLPADQLERFEARVARFTADAPVREQAQVTLASLSDPVLWELWRLALPGAVPISPWFAVVAVVPAAMLALVVAGLLWTRAFAFFFLLILVSVGLRALLSWHLKVAVEPFRRLGLFFAAAARLARLPGAEFAATGEEMRTQLGSLARLRRRAWWVGSAGGRDPLSLLMSYLNLFFLLDFNALRLAARDLAAHGPALLLLMRRVGELDAALAVASWRAGHPGWMRPDFVPDGEPVALHELRHPLLEPAVPHSLALAPPHGVLVTGSNMSGKSTLLRNLGVAAAMAQSVNSVLATGYRAPRFVIRSCIGRGDDLLAGKSYYLVEVDRVLGMVRSAQEGRPHLVLFDELFRGTNTVERIAAGEAVLREMLRPDGEARLRHVVIAATHDAELVDLLDGVYRPWHLSETVDADGLRFDYQLRPGPATSRNAITLLRLQGAPGALIERALARAATLDAARSTRQEPLHA